MKTKIWCAMLMMAFAARTGWGKIVMADQFPGVDAGAKISAAIAAAGDFGVVDARGLAGPQSAANDLVIKVRVQIYLPCGSFTFAPNKGIRIQATGVALLGCGVTATVLVSSGTSGDFISNPDAPTTTYSFTRIHDMDIQTTSTRTAGALLNATNLYQGEVHDVRVMGNWWDVFEHLETNSGNWNYDHVFFPGGQTVNHIWHTKASVGTTSGLKIVQSQVSDFTTYRPGGAGIDLDTGTDGAYVIAAGVGVINIHNSLGGAMPQYIRFEGGGNEGYSQKHDNVDISDGKDISIIGCYFGSGSTAFTITGGQDIKISHNHIVSMKYSALALSGGSRVLFDDNTITDTSQAGSKVYDSISVAAGVSDWYVRNNTFRHTSGYTNIPRRQISVAPGGSDHYQISGNDFGVAGRDFGNAGDAPVSDQGTGRVAVRDYKLY